MGEGHKDIAYHYVIDPAGRVWAARDIKYLGKHVRDWKGVDNRTGNVGVMLLGNFELQRPTAAQVTATQKFVMDLQKKHRVPKQKSVAGVRSKEVGVFMHCELSPTECPGDNMKSQWEALVYPRLIAKF
jgi:N-acetyl-anhydromuramyl-L-alanine amidase AmpD